MFKAVELVPFPLHPIIQFSFMFIIDNLKYSLQKQLPRKTKSRLAFRERGINFRYTQYIATKLLRFVSLLEYGLRE